MNPDSPVMRFLGSLFDLAVLQILFLITSIPIFTIGAGMTAMFSLCWKLQQDSVTSVVRTYFADFKANFRSSTVAWLIILACTLLLVLDIRYYLQGSDAFMLVPLLISYVLLAVVYMEFLYVFPMIAWFDNKLTAHFKNAPMLALYHLLTTVLVSAMYGMIFNVFLRLLPITGLLGFSGGTYLASLFFGNVFRKHGASSCAPAECDSECANGEEGNRNGE